MINRFGKRLLFLGIIVGIPLLVQIQFAEAFDSRALEFAKHTTSPANAKQSDTIRTSDLPREARETLKLIKQGGPFPHSKDGILFGNRESRLPLKPRGYYREYTVRTPGDRTRGARRIVAGSGGEFYYTDDHYNTFKLIEE